MRLGQALPPLNHSAGHGAPPGGCRKPFAGRPPGGQCEQPASGLHREGLPEVTQLTPGLRTQDWPPPTPSLCVTSVPGCTWVKMHGGPDTSNGRQERHWLMALTESRAHALPTPPGISQPEPLMRQLHRVTGSEALGGTSEPSAVL